MKCLGGSAGFENNLKCLQKETDRETEIDRERERKTVRDRD